MNKNIIELLSPDLVEKYPSIVKEIDRLCGGLWLELGWHYILDLVWILNYVESLDLPRGATIIDAGAGRGILQFLLADRGFNVINVDFFPSRRLLLQSLAFSIKKMQGNGKVFEHDYFEFTSKRRNLWQNIAKIKQKILHSRFAPFTLLGMSLAKVLGLRKPGSILIYQADMRKMDSIETKSVDVVVSVSAVEHLDIDQFPEVVNEFRRVLKPGAPMIITTSAAKSEDWFHESSKGWCFSESTLKKFFNQEKLKSNFSEYDRIMEKLRVSTSVRKRMASIYKTSNNSGMPGGIWDPKYQPVGIFIENKAE